MALMCRIDSIPPQIEKAGEQVSQIAGATSQWSSIVFPCVVLNQASKACLQVYREWKEAQETGVGQDEEEPALFVGVIQVTQVLHWSGSTTDGETIITSLGTPTYLGRWAESGAAEK